MSIIPQKNNYFQTFSELIHTQPTAFNDMPHTIFVTADVDARHQAVIQTACILCNIKKDHQDREELGKYFRYDVAMVQVENLRDPVPVKFSSCPRGLFIDVALNGRHKNGIDVMSDYVADAILNFVKGLSCTRDMVHSRRMLVIENFDALPINGMKWFKRTFEKITSSCWVLLTVSRLVRLDASFLGQFCIIRVPSCVSTSDIQKPFDSSIGANTSQELSLLVRQHNEINEDSPLMTRDEAARTAVRRMVARLGKASKCSDLVTAKIPRRVTALGSRGFMKSALSAALDELQFQDPQNKRRFDIDNRCRDLISRITKYDVLQTWGKNRGNIGDDDEAFVDNIIMCTLLQIFLCSHNN